MAENGRPQSVTQAASQVATDVVGSLKGNPILLILVIFNAAFIALVHFTAKDNRERQGEVVDHLLKNQAVMQDMLSRCVVPGRSGVDWPGIGGLPPEEG